MVLKYADLKLLWGRAAGRCSICKAKLVEEKTSDSGVYTIGERAHIVAEDPEGSRGRSILGIEDRNSYYNMILLCPTCHTKIDNNAGDYPVEVLHVLKARHEMWGTQTLTDQLEPVLDSCWRASDLIDTADHFKVLISFIHSSVPENQAEHFFTAFYEMLAFDMPLAGFDNDLRQGLAEILAVLAYGNLEHNDYWVGNKLKYGGYLIRLM